MRSTFRIAGKDLRERLRDRSALMIAVVLPLALTFVYNLVFGSAGQPRAFRYAVADLDRGSIAQAFVGGALHELTARGIITVRTAPDDAAATRLAQQGTVDAAFIIPAGFSAAAMSPGGAALSVVGSADSPTGAAVARAIAQSYTENLNTIRISIAVSQAGAALTPQQIAVLSEQVAHAAAPLALRDASASRKILDSKTYFAAGMAVFFLFFTVQFGVASLIDERANGTLNRLLSMPVRAGEILAGKLLTSVLVGLVSMTVLTTATSLVMGAHWGDPAAVALLVLAGVLAATGLTALVCSLARTAEQAGSWQAVLATLLGLLGGVFFPIAQMGGFAAAASKLSPHSWFLRGLGELAGGGGIAAVLPAVAALLTFAVVTGGIATVRIGRAMRP